MKLKFDFPLNFSWMLNADLVLKSRVGLPLNLRMMPANSIGAKPRACTKMSLSATTVLNVPLKSSSIHPQDVDCEEVFHGPSVGVVCP